MALAMESARIFAQHMDRAGTARSNRSPSLLLSLAGKSLNPHRALLQASRIAASLEKTDRQLAIYGNQPGDPGATLLARLIRSRK